MSQGRIVFVGPHPPPETGTSIPFRTLVQHVCSGGWGVRIVNTQSGNKRNIALVSSKTLFPFLRITIDLVRVVRPGVLVVINGSQRYVATAAALHTVMLRLIGCRVAIYIAGGAFDRYLAGMPSLVRWMVGWCLRRANSVVVQTELCRHGLREILPHVESAPNWCANDIAGSRKARGERCAAPSRETRFVFAGEMIPEKGISLLVEAVGDVRRRLQGRGEVGLDVFGALHPGTSDAICSAIENEPAARFRGKIAHRELMDEFARADAVVLPTWYPSEGHPGVVLEAMTLGVPVITTRFRAIPEIVHDGESGLLCDPGDRESLVECMLRVASDAELCRTISDGAKRAAAKFQPQVVLPDLCQKLGITMSPERALATADAAKR